MAKVPAFISFAAEDARIRDLFVGQGRHPDTPWEIIDWSAHEPFDERWKSQMRSRIKRSHVVIMLVGKNTFNADGATWEIECGFEEGIPAFGVWISKSERGPVPPCLKAENIIEWTWEGVGEMVQKAVQMRQ